MSKTVHSVKLQAYDAVDLNRLSYSNGDVVYDNTNGTLRVMNGTNSGGISLASQTWVTQQIGSLNPTFNGGTVPNATTFAGNVTVTGQIRSPASADQNIISFHFDNQSQFPSASTYHGAIIHSHADGRMYMAHAGAWVPQANFSDIVSLSVTTNSASGSGALSYNAGVFTFTPPVIPTVPTYIVNTTTPNSGGSLSLNGSTFTFAPASVPTYTVTTASANGGGSLSLSGSTFTFSPASVYTLPASTSSALGGVIIPAVLTSGITNTSGTIGLATASNSQLGGVKIDASSITINGSGVISVPAVATVGQPSGIATLDSTGRLTTSQIPTSLTGAVVYKGTWNANTNSPTLTNGTGTQGNEYAVSVGGTVNFGAGNITFNAGDFVIYNGTAWQQIPGGSVAAASTLTGTTLASNVVSSSLTSVGTLANLTVTNTISGSVSGSAGSVAASNITGVTLASNVTGSSLTSVGTITSGVWNGSIISATYLPTGSSSVAGAVKVDGTSITASGGVITAVTQIPNITVNTNSPGVQSLSYSSGTLTFTPYSLPTATTGQLGGVIIDGTTITINGSGVISAAASGYSLPTASTTTLGGVKIDGTSITINNSTQQISAVALPTYGAITTLQLGNSANLAYTFSQYSGNNPTIYAISGTTIAFSLIGGHPFLIQNSSGVNLTSGLISVSPTGATQTGSNAQGQSNGTLYWQIPFGGQGSYKYQCGNHAAMNGNFVVVDISTISTV